MSRVVPIAKVRPNLLGKTLWTLSALLDMAAKRWGVRKRVDFVEQLDGDPLINIGDLGPGESAEIPMAEIHKR